MPLLGFTVFKDKLLSGKKTQTIRLPRKHPFHVGDKLYVYWKPRTRDCRKIGEATLVELVRKKVMDLDLSDALLDGFNNEFELMATLQRLHPNMGMTTEVDVVTWHWNQSYETPELRLKCFEKSALKVI